MRSGVVARPLAAAHGDVRMAVACLPVLLLLASCASTTSPPAEAPPAESPPVAAPVAENPALGKWTPEAAAILARMRSLADFPIAAGLRDLEGTVEVTGIEVRGAAAGLVLMRVTFRAPMDIQVAPVDGASLPGDRAKAFDQAAAEVRAEFAASMGMEALPFGLLNSAVAADIEGAVEREGEATVLVLRWRNLEGPPTECRVAVDARGLPAQREYRTKDPEVKYGQVVDATFEPRGAAFISATESFWFRDPAIPGDFAKRMAALVTREYAGAGGMNLLRSYRIRPPIGRPWAFRFTELSVNGSPVDLR